MNWHYLEGSEQRGPVTDAELEALFRAGTVRPDTLVWREGMAEWQPYAQAKSPPGGAPLRMAGPVSAPPGQVLCAECGQAFPPEEVIRHGNQFICAACKPVFLQKLKEGVVAPGTMVYAGFWIRFCAKFLDGIILGVPSFVVNYFIAQRMGISVFALPLTASVPVGLVLGGSYYTWFVGKYGATPGKMAAKLLIVNPDGSKVSYAKAAGRFLASEYVSGCFTLLIGYLMVCWDSEKRALHDRICSTRVIRT
jgi:uncharacterized RDD family membrane protein YckC